MSKIRLYNLAKDMDLDNKELLRIVKELGIDAKSHASTLTDEQVDQVQEYYLQLEYAKQNAAAENVHKDKKEGKPAKKEEDIDPEESKKPKKGKPGKGERVAG